MAEFEHNIQCVLIETIFLRIIKIPLKVGGIKAYQLDYHCFAPASAGVIYGVVVTQV
jgi:hypothetical protein